jgi:hypothetical protein
MLVDMCSVNHSNSSAIWAIMSKGLKDFLAKMTLCYICIQFFELLLKVLTLLLSLKVSEIFMVENWPFLYLRQYKLSFDG